MKIINQHQPELRYWQLQPRREFVFNSDRENIFDYKILLHPFEPNEKIFFLSCILSRRIVRKDNFEVHACETHHSIAILQEQEELPTVDLIEEFVSRSAEYMHGMEISNCDWLHDYVQKFKFRTDLYDDIRTEIAKWTKENSSKYKGLN